MTFTDNTVPFSFLDKELSDMQNFWRVQAAFHKAQILRVKRNLGKGCTYLSHMEVGGRRFIKAILDNGLGKDNVDIEIDSNLNLFKQAEYDGVMETLGKRLYDGSTKRI